MSLHRFFTDTRILEALDEAGVFVAALTDEDAAHARVLRLRAGEHIAFIDGTLDYFEAEVIDVSKHDITARVAKHEVHAPSSVQLVLVQGLAKGSKLEEVIRHATEVGVDAFIPFSADRSVLKLEGKQREHKMQRWQSIAKSAAMQAGRNHVPEVHDPQSLDNLSALLDGFDAVLVFWEEARPEDTIERALEPLRSSIERGKTVRIACIIGPEGGLSVDEINIMKAWGQTSIVTLGPSILRTETAGVVAPALVQYELYR